jgi:hypothetical protein
MTMESKIFGESSGDTEASMKTSLTTGLNSTPNQSQAYTNWEGLSWGQAEEALMLRK